MTRKEARKYMLGSATMFLFIPTIFFIISGRIIEFNYMYPKVYMGTIITIMIIDFLALINTERMIRKNFKK